MHFWLLILFSVLLQIVLIPIIHADIGSISELKGNGEIRRENTTDSLLAELALDIFSNDDVRTGNGRIAIRFVDDTLITLTEHSKVIIDSFVYDTDRSKSELALSFVRGTGRFLSSKTKRKIPNENVKIRTNSATIGIRGTSFSVSSEPDTGRDLIILLPNEDGTSSGEITVTTMAGTVVLTEAFQATVVTVAEQMPTRPVVLSGLTLDFIDNLLIINPPEETERAVEEQNASADNILDVDLLENDLDTDYLEEDELENIDRLDIDLLSIDFLVDLLDVIETNVNKQAEVNVLEGVEIEGITPPFDPTTQTFTFVEGSMLTIFRQVENTVDLQIDKDSAFNISILSAGQEINATINGGGEGEIFINQSN
jgi:hypothetical protein